MYRASWKRSSAVRCPDASEPSVETVEKASGPGLFTAKTPHQHPDGHCAPADHGTSWAS